MSEVSSFTKKPVTIQAKQLTVDDCWAQWVDGLAFWPPEHLRISGSYHAGNRTISYAYIQIPTLEGVMTAQVGDWIIKGIRGEFYPCKPDIFEATYDPARSATHTATELIAKTVTIL